MRYLSNYFVPDIRASVFVGPNIMRIGIEKPTFITLKSRPTPQQVNALHILGEYPNRLVPKFDLCDRLGVTKSSLAVHICRLRGRLTDDWTIESRHGCFRLIDLRGK